MARGGDGDESQIPAGRFRMARADSRRLSADDVRAIALAAVERAMGADSQRSGKLRRDKRDGDVRLCVC